MDKTLSGQLFATNRYSLQFAKTEAELRAAQSLRYRVFNLELGEGLEKSHQQCLDVDQYDLQCDHLIVVDRKTDGVIGTYRLQTYQKAIQRHGLYTSDEFDLSSIPQEILKQTVEVGRACIQKEHRNGRVLYLLWRGIAKYMEITDLRYLLGCCSIKSTNPAEGWTVWDYLRENDHIHSSLSVDTKDDYHCPDVDRDAEAWKHITLPQLFNLYIDLGAKTLSKPALDRAFQTIDFLILVDLENLDERSRTLFFR
ncbi:GNAT family N-acetyltransferase [Fodinibius sp. AD559]|uniref:GNAT family N-acetyltransferase n=1 Tax=Fodinibius sp. AD559 TaxID=3424179 RepID=UPI0040469264